MVTHDQYTRQGGPGAVHCLAPLSRSHGAVDACAAQYKKERFLTTKFSLNRCTQSSSQIQMDLSSSPFFFAGTKTSRLSITPLQEIQLHLARTLTAPCSQHSSTTQRQTRFRMSAGPLTRRLHAQTLIKLVTAAMRRRLVLSSSSSCRCLGEYMKSCLELLRD
jgi:hypothetical protein